MSHRDEIADALAGGTAPTLYIASSFTNGHGKNIVRLQFNSTEDLEEFFIHEMIGLEKMKKSSSKAIGRTLLIWDR